MDLMVGEIFIHDAVYGVSGQKLLEALIDVTCLSQKAVDDVQCSFRGVQPIAFRPHDFAVGAVLDRADIAQYVPGAVHFFSAEEIAVIPLLYILVPFLQSGVCQDFLDFPIGKADRRRKVRGEDVVGNDIVHARIGAVFYRVQTAGKQDASDIPIGLADIAEHVFDHVPYPVIIRRIQRLRHRDIIFIDQDEGGLSKMLSAHPAQKLQCLLRIRLFSLAP